MKTIVIYASGTLGDHLPCFALGQALQRLGYGVKLIINQAMHSDARRAGLEALAFSDIERGPEHTRQNAWAWDHWNMEDIPVDIPSLPELYGEYLTQIRDMAQICQDADLLLATSIRSHGLALHYVTDLPWVTISLNAMTFTAPVTSSEKQTKGDARLLEFQAFKPMIDYVCEQFGVKKSLPPWRPGWSFARHILLASSPYFSHVELSQLQPHSSIDQTGFWFYEDPAWLDWQPSAELSAFCERRPLSLAFSSQPVQDTRRLLELHVAAAKLVGLPLLIQRGWAGFSESDLPPDFDPAQVMFADYLPHDWLFARCSASIQHGGIGSIARALRQACPLLIEPFGNDQLFNARQVASLGAGAFTPPFETTPESLARLLEESVLTEAARQRAARLGAAISAERGLEDACEMIDRYLGRLTPAGAHPQIYDKFTPPLTPRSKQASLPQPERVFNLLLLQGKETSRIAPLTEADMARLLEQPAPLPPVSCLMVTNDRFSLARGAVDCFLRQDYPHKELVIIDEGQGDALERWVASLADQSIRYQRIRGAKLPLGELRNLALNAAQGEFVATWDDDDLYHPRRLSCQMAALTAAQADACCLGRLFIWWQDSDRLAISHLRTWENSLLARKDRLPLYPAISQGSDTAVIEQLIERGRLVLLDYPELYLYVYHGSNVWGAGHWQDFWSQATLRLTGEKSQQMLRMLGAELQVELQQAEPPVELSSPSSPLEILHPPSQPAGEIPHILHQTWKDENLPEQLRFWRRSWLEKHPDWTYHLWTDTDLRQLIQRHYAWFLPIYDHYPEQIMRVDAARCFILHHYGGVYADLDIECLRPLDSLLEGKRLLFGLEPEAHLQQEVAMQSGLKQIISNALMASQPGDPFWQHAFLELVASHRQAGPLDAAGPFFLTRAVESYPERASISLEPAASLFPIDNNTSWGDLPESDRQRLAQTAFTVHHHMGSWWRSSTGTSESQARIALFQHSKFLGNTYLELPEALKSLRRQSVPPLISCLMVTHGRLALAQRSIACFLRQTYPNLELLILDDDPDPALADWLAQLADARIRYLHLPDEHRSLGELRNLAIENAAGAYLAQWDDDDLSHPLRLEVQLAVIQALQLDACMLERHQIWWQESQRLAYSNRRMWESSFLCVRSKLPAYPPLRKGEDTLVMRLMLRAGRTALLDMPELYTYVFHGANTFASSHWEQHWQQASAKFEGALYENKLRQIEASLGLDLRSGELPAIQSTARQQLPGKKISARFPASADSRAKKLAQDQPPVLILTPVKDAEAYLPLFWENLRRLNYPHSSLSVAFLESDSRDGTYQWIESHLPALRREFARAELFKRDYASVTDLPRWRPEIQFMRRSILARSRNYLLSRALGTEDWVLWIDVDVAEWPVDIIEQLLAPGKDIVVPHCLQKASRQTFDLNTFKLAPGAEEIDWSPYIVDGILQPPRGLGRLYLSDLRQHDLVEVDAVGGCMLLVNADLHREGLIFPALSYKLLIETEGLAALARDMGISAWGMPNLEILHP